MKLPKKRSQAPLRALLCASLWALPGLALHGQEEDDDGIFELSPFEVSSEEDTGYRAANTMAGTRLSTRLEDVATPVQVVTEEFMEDIGANDITQLLVYTTGTEAPNFGGNFSNASLTNATARTEFIRRSPQLNTRVRGLAEADLTRDFFLSEIAFDSYNTDSIAINRGPNAALFGLGSPGGILNASLKQANVNETFGETSFKWDEFGTGRWTIDYNQVVIPEKLGVRLAWLQENQEWEQNEAFEDDDRFFATATYRPFKTTKISANWETGDIEANRPFAQPPRDELTSWFANGKPGWNPVTRQWTVNGEVVENPELEDALFEGSQNFAGSDRPSPMFIFADPNSSEMGGNGGPATVQMAVRPDQAGRPGSDAFPHDDFARMKKWGGSTNFLGVDDNLLVGGRPDVSTDEAAFFSNLSMTDRDIFDFRNEMLMGPNKRERQTFDAWQASFEQTALENKVGIEFSYNEQTYYDDLLIHESAGGNGSFSVDINTHLLDGSPNPNFGRPITAGGGFAEQVETRRDAWRVTGFGELDFSEDFGDASEGMLRWFGRHRLTGLFQHQEQDSQRKTFMNANAGPGFSVNAAREGALDAAGASDRIGSIQRATSFRALGPSMVNAATPQDAEIQGVTVFQPIVSTDDALLWNPFTGQMETQAMQWFNFRDDPEQTWLWGNSRNVEEIDSIVGILQSHFLNDNVVTTVSWRNDDIEQFVGEAPTDPATGLTRPVLPELGPKQLDESESQVSWGVVAHTPEFINERLPFVDRFSIHFNDSENFAAGQAGRTIFNETAPFQSGETEDYGFSVTAFQNKFHVRVNWFDTVQSGSRISGQPPTPWSVVANIMENNSPEELAAVGFSLDQMPQGFFDSVDFGPDNPNVPNNETDWAFRNPAQNNVQVTQDTATEGVEIETTYNPTKNWRFHLNAANAESQVSSVMPLMQQAFERLEEIWFSNPEVANNLFVLAERALPSGEIDPNAVLATSNLLAGQRAQLASATANEGGTVQELRKWRLNFITNYEFDGSFGPDWLSGLGVGAGLRWQSKVGIGAPLTVEQGATVPDNDNPFFGGDQTNIDVWSTYKTSLFQDRYEFQLQARIRNVNSNEGLIPIRANPDGEIALWRLEAPTTLELTAKLRF